MSAHRWRRLPACPSSPSACPENFAFGNGVHIAKSRSSIWRRGLPAALVSAVLDALAPLGVDDIEMPVTPRRIWQAIEAAGNRVGG